jgi:uncharacterized alkaline shock family protein YloU
MVGGWTMQVYSLVGASGTGKSHRATLVAREHNVDCIVDDGLLIKGSKILAGRSAKREKTGIAAVRTAILMDEEHAGELREALDELDPDRVLVLGTSKRMVYRIVDALDLPRPEKHILINEVATPDQIEHARDIRRRHGKHVIPAPTLEVKKSFSGYLVDPLRLFYRRARGSEAIIEKSMVRPTFSSLGQFSITDSVVVAIARRACAETEDIAEVLKTTVNSTEDGVVIDVGVVVSYGHRVIAVLKLAQKRARDMVTHMTALNVLELNITARRISLEGRREPWMQKRTTAAEDAGETEEGGSRVETQNPA